MRIWVLLLMALFFLQGHSQNSQASPLEREVSLFATNEPISKILKQVEKQAHLSFSYNSMIIDDTKRISGSFKNKKVEEVINVLFDNKIKCKAKENHVILCLNTKTSSHIVSKNQLEEIVKNKKNIEIEKSANTLVSDIKPEVSIDTSIQYLSSVSTVRVSGNSDFINPDSMQVLPSSVLHPAIPVLSPSEENTGIVPEKKQLSPFSHPFEVGLIAGPGLVNAMGIGHNPFKIGGSIGGYMEIKINNKLYFQPELLFSFKGYSHSTTQSLFPFSIATHIDQRLYYIEMPLQLAVKVTQRFNIICGPYASVLVAATYTSTVTSDMPASSSYSTTTSIGGTGGTSTTTTSSSSSVPLNSLDKGNNVNNFNVVDIGATIGAIYHLNKRLFLAMNYSKGFTNLKYSPGGKTITNSVFMLRVGYQLK